jgi:uncharacterized protein
MLRVNVQHANVNLGTLFAFAWGQNLGLIVSASRHLWFTMPFDLQTRPLSVHELRVLGVLMEKARTVPDSYPLTLNTLTIGCNQKTSRAPVMDMSEAEAQAALDSLRSLSLVFEASGARVTRWEHNFQRIVGVAEQHAVILGLLMLRGPQTSAELRTNAERWYKFADSGSVEVFLTELAAFDEATGLGRKPEDGPALTVLLPREPGARERRWTHLLGGAVEISEKNSLLPSAESASIATENIAIVNVAGTYAALQTRIATLEERVQTLETALKDQLGLQL